MGGALAGRYPYGENNFVKFFDKENTKDSYYISVKVICLGLCTS